MTKKELKEQATKILIEAQERGIQSDFFFRTTFERYLTQIKILSGLEKEIRKTGLTVKKQYVKGRENLYTNPAITEYNKTATAANSTVSTLINILRSLEVEEPAEGGKLQRLRDSLLNSATLMETEDA